VQITIFFRENSCFLTIFTLTDELLLSYNRITNLTRRHRHFSVTSDGTADSLLKAVVDSGNECHVFHADFFPRPTKDDVVAQPVMA